MVDHTEIAETRTQPASEASDNATERKSRKGARASAGRVSGQPGLGVLWIADAGNLRACGP